MRRAAALRKRYPCSVACNDFVKSSNARHSHIVSRTCPQVGLQCLFVDQLQLLPSKHVPQCYVRASDRLLQSSTYWVFLTLAMSCISLGIILDHEWLALVSIVSAVALAVPVLVPRLDVTQWRVVLGTSRNVVVFVGCLVGFALDVFLLVQTQSSVVALVSSMLCWASTLFVFIFVEVMDVPVLGLALGMMPAVAGVTGLIVGKYSTTGVFLCSGIHDHTFPVGPATFSVLNIMNSIATVCFFLFAVKTKMTWDLAHGKTIEPFLVKRRTRIIRSHHPLDNHLQSPHTLRVVLAYHCLVYLGLATGLIYSV